MFKMIWVVWLLAGILLGGGAVAWMANMMTALEAAEMGVLAALFAAVGQMLHSIGVKLGTDV